MADFIYTKKELTTYNTEVAESLQITSVIKSIRKESVKTNECFLLGTDENIATYIDRQFFDEYFWMMVHQGLEKEELTNEEKTSCLLAAYSYSLFIEDQTSLPLFRKLIGAKCISKILFNLKAHVNEDKLSKTKSPETILSRAEFIVNQLAYNNRSFRRVGTYTCDEAPVRIMRDAVRMFVFLPKEVLEQYVNVYHSHNLSIRKYNAVNDEPLVSQNFQLFLNNYYNEHITTPWYTLWGKKHAFAENYTGHAKKILKMSEPLATI